MAPQVLAGFHALSGDAGLDPALAERTATTQTVLRFIRVQLLGPRPGPSPRALDWADGVYQLLEGDRLMHVACSQHGGKGIPLPSAARWRLLPGFPRLMALGSTPEPHFCGYVL